MQMQLPLFPPETRLINNTLGVVRKDSTVFYLHNGSPIFCHEESDLNNYRYILGNLVEMKLCSCSEMANALGIPVRTVQRYAKAYREKGSDWFFHRERKRGTCHKLDDKSFIRVQDLLDEGVAVSRIAREMGVTEGAIRHHIRTGKLKKK